MLTNVLNYLAQIWPFSNWLLITLPIPVEINPEFEVVEPTEDGFLYNPDFYATEACTEQVMHRFGAMLRYKKTVKAGEVYAPPQWYLRFMDGLEINAGQLAKFFAVYPEKKYPGVAVRYGITLIAANRHDAGLNAR